MIYAIKPVSSMIVEIEVFWIHLLKTVCFESNILLTDIDFVFVHNVSLTGSIIENFGFAREIKMPCRHIILNIP
jgi:hypothetical protein